MERQADGYVIAYKGTFEESDSNVFIDNAVQITLPKTAAKQEFKDSDGNVVASLSKKNKAVDHETGNLSDQLGGISIR